MACTLQVYHHPAALPRSPDHQVRVNGEVCDVLRVPILGGQLADVVIAGLTGSADVEITCVGASARLATAKPAGETVVRPLHSGIQAKLANGRIALHVTAPIHAVVEQPEAVPVFLLLAPPPSPPPADAIRLAAGIVHNLGAYEVPAGKTLWLEGGAVLCGAVRARGPGAAVRGHGIIDGSCFTAATTGHVRSLILDRCAGGLVEGVTIINPSCWCCVLGACDGARVSGLRVFGDVCCSDGVDLCGCRDTVVEDCLLCCNDDCVAIKACDIRRYTRPERPETDVSWERDISNLLIQRCVMLNGPCGGALEIGGETRCDYIRDITWRDIDILCVHGHGAPFTIHVLDRATVSAIRYEDIRIEHHWARLLDLRISRARSSRDTELGQMPDLSFNRINAALPCNYGYTAALIGGYNSKHTVEGVHFTNFVFNGVPVHEGWQMNLFTHDASGITFD